MKIKKISQPLKVEGDIIDSLSSASRENAPSIHAVYRGVYGYELYNNTQGGNSDLLLADNVANYKYVEIFYNKINNDIFGSKKIDNPNNKRVGLDLAFVETDDHSQLVTQEITFRDNNIIYGRGLWTNFKTDGTIYSSDHVDEPLIYITKVIGYK